MVGTGKGKTIWVTDKEYIFIKQSKDLFSEFTGAKISWGAYLVILSMGGLAAKCLDGVKLRCPDCESETDMTLYMPEVKPHRRPISQSSGLRSQTPKDAV